MEGTTTPKSFIPPTCDDRLIWDVVFSVYHFPALTVADELDLFSYLDRKPSSADEISKHLALSPRSTEALLGVLTSLGFLTQRMGVFHITEASRNFLLPESSFYWGGILKLLRDMPFTHSSILEALKKDGPVGYRGKDLWETHEIDPAQAKVFTSAMHSHSFPAATGVARWGDFEGVKKLLDVGGGSACFPITLALRYPEMSFTILELPVICALAEGYIKEYGLSDRIDTIGRDMFNDPFPEGYDAVFFSNIYHDWEIERCRELTRKSFDSLPARGRIYVHELLLDDSRDGSVTATSFSMNMIYFTRGKQFTAGELTDMLREAGFTDVTVNNTYGYYSLVSASKP